MVLLIGPLPPIIFAENFRQRQKHDGGTQCESGNGPFNSPLILGLFTGMRDFLSPLTLRGN